MRARSALDLAVAAAARFGGHDEGALRQQLEEQHERRADTLAKQQQAQAIGAGRLARGDGAELGADTLPPGARARGAKPAPAAPSPAKAKQGKRAAKKLKDTLVHRRMRDNARATAQAEKKAEQALQTHGIYHHYRPLPKLAYFTAYMANTDRNGLLALQALSSINMPAARISQVLKAAYEPQGYTPHRDVCRGERANQTRYEFDGRELGRRTKGEQLIDRPQWAGGHRDLSHPGAIKVICCAIFLWLSKGRTRRRGYSYAVRGFGRGVFESICGCGKDALTGHTDGMPGALRALAQAGFVQYGQPPTQVVTQLDRGPSGHAYNAYWFPATAEETALEAHREQLAEVVRLPVVERLVADPSQLAGGRVHGPSPPSSAPPDFTDADIPY